MIELWLTVKCPARIHPVQEIQVGKPIKAHYWGSRRWIQWRDALSSCWCRLLFNLPERVVMREFNLFDLNLSFKLYTEQQEEADPAVKHPLRYQSYFSSIHIRDFSICRPGEEFNIHSNQSTLLKLTRDSFCSWMFCFASRLRNPPLTCFAASIAISSSGPKWT